MGLPNLDPLDVFPADQKSTIRAQLAMVLEAVVSQTLVARIGGGRVVASEVLVANTGIRNLIREDKVHQLQGMLEIGQKIGMQTMNQDLARLFHKGQISMKEALGSTPDPDGLQKLLD